MKVLVLGGTRFIGRHLITRLLDAGHNVTLLNRGKTGAGLFPELPRIQVDRKDPAFVRAPGLVRDWDGVIDMSGYYPLEMRQTLAALEGRVGRYVYCSTVSVYEGLEREGFVPMLSEDDALLPCTAAQETDETMASYGARKAECERILRAVAGLGWVILRPSVVFGEWDYTDRFAYWIARAAGTAPFILPEHGLTITRRTYAPDLAASFVAALSAPSAIGGAYNVAEAQGMSLRDTLAHLGDVLGTRPLERAVSVDAATLDRFGVKAWSDLPFWIKSSHLLVDTFRARRSLGVRETPYARALEEAATGFLREKRDPVAGLSFAAERELLEKIGSKK